MKIKSYLAVAAALTMAGTPIAATAAPVANSASKLSLSSSVRAGSASGKSEKLAGGGLIAAVLAAGVAAIGVIAIVNDSDDDNSDSN